MLQMPFEKIGANLAHILKNVRMSKNAFLAKSFGSQWPGLMNLYENQEQQNNSISLSTNYMY